MKIAMMVRGFLPVPRPPGMIYAPIDLAYTIGLGMIERGHKVDFYAPSGSKPEIINVQSDNLLPLARNQQEFQDLIDDASKMTHYLPAMWDAKLAGVMFKRAAAGDYDILHFHHPETAMLLASIYSRVPAVYTLHDPIYQWYRELFELYESPNQYLVSISDNQRRDAPDLNYIRTVYNGIDLKDYPFSSKPEDYLLFSGRIIPEKGVKEAVQVALKSHNRLLIIGSISPDNQWYFDRYVKPYLGEQILYLGYMEREIISRYYRKAKAVLTPVQWDEPFGLTTIEAMATGTPVISFQRGAAQEIIVHQKTGFLVNSFSEMVEAVHNVDKLKRSDCRAHVKRNFTVDKMVDGYEQAFEEVLNSRRKLSTRFMKETIEAVPKRLTASRRKHQLKARIKSKSPPKPR